jgi:hypothetical protein
MKRNNELLKEMDNCQKMNKDNLFKDILLQVIGDFYMLDYGYVTDKNRKREVVFARQVAMHILLKNTKWTLGKIGENFNRDHATVLHSDRVIKDYLSYCKLTKTEVNKIEKLTHQKMSIILKKEKADSGYHYIDLDNYTSVMVTNKKCIIFSGYTEHEIFEILTTLEIGDVDTFNHKKTGSYILERINNNDGNTRNTTSIDS